MLNKTLWTNTEVVHGRLKMPSLSLSHLGTVSFQERGRVIPFTTQFPQYECTSGTGEIYLQWCSAVVLCIQFYTDLFRTVIYIDFPIVPILVELTATEAGYRPTQLSEK
jgi:hypothetical protein